MPRNVVPWTQRGAEFFERQPAGHCSSSTLAVVQTCSTCWGRRPQQPLSRGKEVSSSQNPWIQTLGKGGSICVWVFLWLVSDLLHFGWCTCGHSCRMFMAHFADGSNSSFYWAWTRPHNPTQHSVQVCRASINLSKFWSEGLGVFAISALKHLFKYLGLSSAISVYIPLQYL